MRKLEMPKFKNELTLDKNEDQQEQNFITSPVDGLQYLIYWDGTLYQYLLHHRKKDGQEYVKKLPFLMDWSPEEWVIFDNKPRRKRTIILLGYHLLIYVSVVAVLKVMKLRIQQSI